MATGITKAGIYVGTEVAANAIIRKDAKDNGYITNMDSVISASSTEDLIALNNELVRIGGYSSSEELMDNSSNESLKNNVSALELAIAGRQVAESDEGILNREYIILNKKTYEKTVVYKSNYKEEIAPLLLGCYQYLSMDKKAQNELQKWNSLTDAMRLMESCY